MPGMLAKGRVYRFTYFANKWHVTGGKVEPHTRYVTFNDTTKPYATIYKYSGTMSVGQAMNLPYPLVFTIDGKPSDDKPGNTDDYIFNAMGQGAVIISGDINAPSVITLGAQSIDGNIGIRIKSSTNYTGNSYTGPYEVSIDLYAPTGVYGSSYCIRTISNPSINGYDEPDDIMLNNDSGGILHNITTYGEANINGLYIPGPGIDESTDHDKISRGPNYFGDKILTTENVTHLKIISNKPNDSTPATYETLTYQDIQTIHNLSNTSADDNIVFGVYEGDDTADRLINLGFRPAAVEVYKRNGQFYSSATGESATYGGLAIDGYPCVSTDRLNITNPKKCIEIVDNGFMVNYTDSSTAGTTNARTNLELSIYYFKAYRKATPKKSMRETYSVCGTTKRVVREAAKIVPDSKKPMNSFCLRPRAYNRAPATAKADNMVTAVL